MYRCSHRCSLLIYLTYPHRFGFRLPCFLGFSPKNIHIENCWIHNLFRSSSESLIAKKELSFYLMLKYAYDKLLIYLCYAQLHVYYEVKMYLSECIKKYLSSVKLSRSANTYRTYQNAMNLFIEVLLIHDLDSEKTSVSEVREDAIIWMAAALKDFSPATEQVYMTATVGLYEFIAGENLAQVNLPRVRLLIKQRTRRPGVRLPQFPKCDIEKVLVYAEELKQKPTERNEERLINLRDRAFLITLADTGLRVHEACELRRGDIDWHESRAAVIGKGNKEAILRFSKRSLSAMKDYLQVRAELDGVGGKALASLPVFARHDKAVGKKIKPISTTTGRAIVKDRVRECLGEDAVGTITPHSFRHYFVTTILGSTGNLKLAQVLARHTNIAVTQRYSHLADDELDKKYQEIFDDD